MRQVTRKGLITMAAASGVLAAMSGGTAYADSGAQGGSQGSPGVLSGNTVEVPVDVPVNACGNSANVVGVLNPVTGNDCGSDGSDGDGQGGGAQAQGSAQNSPGVGSGNHVEVPVDAPVNACGNGITGVGGLNPVSGNGCGDDGGSQATQPSSESSEPGGSGTSSGQGRQSDMTPAGSERPLQHSDISGSSQPEAQPRTQLNSSVSSGSAGELAETGSGQELGAAGALGAGLMVGGYVLYRRARVMQR